MEYTILFHVVQDRIFYVAPDMQKPRSF